MRWDAPGPGTWWLEREHFPVPLSGLFADVFPPVTDGWIQGAARYGLAWSTPKWVTVNCWMYYGTGTGGLPPADSARDEVAARARAEAWWRDEVRRWEDAERPQVVAVNRALQSEDLSDLDDGALVDHIERCLEHFQAVAPLHYEHAGNYVCNEVLRAAAASAGFPDLDVGRLAVGSSPASTRPALLVREISDAVTEAGIDDVTSLDDVRHASEEAARRLDTYLDEYGWRLVESYDPSFPALMERPELIVASIRACLTGRWRGGPASSGDKTHPPSPWGDVDGLAVEVTSHLDELLSDARALYAMRDDDDGTCVFWPLGLVRRAVLEAGSRLADRGRLVAATDLFEASSSELLAVVADHAEAPGGHELARRARSRAEAAAVIPPASLDGGGTERSAEPPALKASDGRLRGTAIGTGVGVGRARVHRSGDDVLVEIEPSDVLVVVTTTPAFNTLFPLLAGIVTEVGSHDSHAALLSRELGVPAVLGVPGAMQIPDGALVEVNSDTGICTVLDPA